MPFEKIVFYLFAAILVFAATRVITVRNPVHAALHLVLAFFTSAALWLLLEAEFLAITLVLVYVGLLILALPLCWWRARVYVRHTRWALLPDVVMFRYGWLTRRLVVTPRNRLQSVQLSTSPFDRRYHMANLSLDTAGGGGLHDAIYIRYLTAEIAQALAVRLYHSHVDVSRHAGRRTETAGG